MNPDFIKPRYDEGGFAGIPTRVENAFASGNYDAVVLFLVDAFGWRFYERFQDAPFIQRIAKHGRIEPTETTSASAPISISTIVAHACRRRRRDKVRYKARSASPLLIGARVVVV